ncbi:rod shape-determining protein MreD [Ammoniphilus resinae]|uniref:Rod shape-determining protein MreD n=1 Tax=Ammoniphilus resinae TaxID=861532 RepID=A0ABS4GJG9_9BACL|nr:rod shape-determining protein MreD [Ammoniphilus resinae]MBP1930408.1 rod shape-determining protein MreD [Ammoniphilus resinae]
MKWGILATILAGVFIMEGTVLQIFIAEVIGSAFHFLPRFGLIIIIFISLYLGRRKAFFIGLVYGLFIDLLYGDVIGAYAFSMAVIPYLCALAYQYFQLNVLLVLITVFIGVYIHEIIGYGMLDLFGLTGGESFDWSQYIPTAFLNTFIAAIIYRPLTSFLETMGERRIDEAV